MTLARKKCIESPEEKSGPEMEKNIKRRGGHIIIMYNCRRVNMLTQIRKQPRYLATDSTHE